MKRKRNVGGYVMVYGCLFLTIAMSVLKAGGLLSIPWWVVFLPVGLIVALVVLAVFIIFMVTKHEVERKTK